MNKSAIQKYAIWARNELRNQISQKAYQYGITPDKKPERGLESIDGRLLTPLEQKQRDKIVDLVNRKASDGKSKPDYKKGFDQMVEEAAYTWFNRLIAIRFMEVNDYLPDHIRVLSNSNNEYKPEILSGALDLDEEHFNKDLILRLIEEGKQEELYRYLLLAECNSLNEILPVMFEKMDGYTELLLPNNLLKADSVIGRLVTYIDESDWKVVTQEDRENGVSDEEGGQVQIIGWLYQYYNSELKDQTFADLKKKNVKISKERIPAATQLFTPDWIVRYMVENSLGRLWLEGHPNDELKSKWKYYLDEAKQDQEVEEQLKEIRKEYAKLKPEDLTVADIAMGSGHILVYAFDVLMQIYQSQGIRTRDAVKSILENNLYGLDIDDRAAQLAYFAIMMKAREYDRRILTRGIQPNLFAIQESNDISEELIEYFADGNKELNKDLRTLIREMKDAKEYGSIISVSQLNYTRMELRLEEIQDDYGAYSSEARDKIKPLIDAGKILSSKMWVCCMNPPYLGAGGMSIKLASYIKNNYKNSKADLFAVFMEKSNSKIHDNGICALITQHSWMFLPSFVDLRKGILANNVLNMIHLGSRAFEDIGGEVVQTTAFVVSKNKIKNYKGIYYRLIDGLSQREKQLMFLEGYGYFSINNSVFSKLPDAVLSYWIPDTLINVFEDYPALSSISMPRKGLATMDNNRFLRRWFEIDFNKAGIGYKNAQEAQESGKKWFPLNKGGSYRKWYGNKEYFINWENDGIELKNFITKKYNGGSYTKEIRSEDKYFLDSITWSALTTGDLSFRYSNYGAIFDSAGSSLFAEHNVFYLLGLLNSNVTNVILGMLNPTLNFGAGSVGKLPIIYKDDVAEEIVGLVKKNIYIAKNEWDSSELSWEFSRHRLIPKEENKSKLNGYKIENLFDIESKKYIKDKTKLSNNERKLDDIFDSIYELNDKKNHTDDIRPLDKSDEVKSLISYAVGLLVGRYSLKSDGIMCTNSEILDEKYSVISPDPDNIIPVGELEYFEDDLVSKFIDLIKEIYGADTLEENLDFIANELGGNGTSREVIRKYFLNDFFADHCKMYKKRPIYWLFDSGKKNGFKCLIYMHRYQPDTLARIRTDYVLEQQERYRSQIKHINETINEVTAKSEQMKMKKQLKDLDGKLAEVTKYEEKIHHLADQMIKIDLDDGVKHNYAIFQDVLAKIK